MGIHEKVRAGLHEQYMLLTGNDITCACMDCVYFHPGRPQKICSALKNPIRHTSNACDVRISEGEQKIQQVAQLITRMERTQRKNDPNENKGQE